MKQLPQFSKASLEKTLKQYKAHTISQSFAKPVFIVSAPRSGSNLLFETLTQSESLWTIGGESHALMEVFPKLLAEHQNFDSERLDASSADEKTTKLIKAGFYAQLQNSRGDTYTKLEQSKRPKRVRFLEKTPRNALNVPFLNALFPDAQFIYLHRDAASNIGSIMDAWMVGQNSGRFVRYTSLPGWDRQNWCLLLPPGWRELRGKTLAEIAAFQWQQANQFILDDLAALEQNRWCSISYERFIADPSVEIQRLCTFCDIPFDASLKQTTGADLAISKTAVKPPSPDKWKKHEKKILPVLPSLNSTIDQIRQLAKPI